MAKEPKQIIDIPELNNGNGAAQLELSTRKYSNGQIVSSAHVHFVKNGMVTFMLYGDFHMTLLCNTARATQKTLDQQHATAFNPDAIERLKAEAIFFYANKRNKAA